MQFGKFPMAPADVWIGRKLGHGAAMSLPFLMVVDVLVVTHS